MKTYTFRNVAEMNALFDAVYFRGTDDPRANAALLSDPRADAAYFYVMEGQPAEGDHIVIEDA